MLYKNHCICTFENSSLPRLKQNEARSFSFSTEDFPASSFMKVRLTGDIDVQPNWMWEGGYPLLYRLIDDSLCTDTLESQFSLRMKMNGEPWPRSAFCRIPCPPRLTPQFPAPAGDGNWELSILAKTDHLKILPGGRVCLAVEKYLKKDGINPHDLSGKPDETAFISFPEGTRGFTRFSLPVRIDEGTAGLLIYVTAESAEGTVWFENPQMLDRDGHNILPQFTISNPFHPYLNWFGENLSFHDITRIEASLNGTVFYTGDLFQRCHRFSANEFPIPDGLVRKGENILTIRNIDDYFSPVPYRIKKVEILYGEPDSLSVISCPSLVYAEEPFGILIHTAEPGAAVAVSSDSGSIIPDRDEYIFPEAGLNIISCRAGKAAAGLTVSVRCGAVEKTAFIERIIEKTPDNVLTGTGDAIYIPQDTRQMEEFLSWYLNGEFGNFITFRPVYRWSGTRWTNSEMWQRITDLCSRYGLYYCHMFDGRELPGINANPTLKMLESRYFVGSQGHERDGALCYWGPNRAPNENELFFLLLRAKRFSHPDFNYFLPPVYAQSGQAFGYYNAEDPADMKEAAEHFIEGARNMLRGLHRHSGPSVLFKYFLQAGLPVAGAELMYGPHEIILAALRGASLAYHRDEFIGHLAVQWSTTPQDTPEKYRRYRLALDISYMNGVHHINTEEGLWRIEENFTCFNRFDDVCKAYQDIQRDFTHFVKAHSRRGKMVCPTALLHGQYDGWNCFTRRSAWEHLGDSWKFDLPEESWDLTKVFYPDAVLDSIYRHPCENKPQGFYSRTPYGNVDILPVEAEVDILSRYTALAFLGWNTAVPDQFERLLHYVENGGILLLGWPHLFTDTDRVSAIHGTPSPLGNDILKKLIGAEFHGFIPVKTPEGIMQAGNLSLSEDTIIRDFVCGIPAVIEHRTGSGKVLFVNFRNYPAAPEVRPVYETLLKEIAEEGVRRQKERGWIFSGSTVNFSAFDREDGLRDLYAVNINWWEEENTPAEALLLFDGNQIPLSFKRGCMHILTLSEHFGIWSSDNDTDVIRISESDDGIEAVVQGIGHTILHFISTHPVSCPELSLTQDSPFVSCAEADLNGTHTFHFIVK